MSVEGTLHPRPHCEEEPDCIGMAFMQGNVEVLRGKFLCVGHTVPEWLRAQKAPGQAQPRVQPPRDRVPIAADGWVARSWRYGIAEMERIQRLADAERLHFTRRKERKQMAMAARQRLPVLGPRDIRRHRLPLVQSLPLDLEDDGFPMTSSIIEGFIHYNNQMRAMAPKGSPFYDEPPIADKPDLLLRLATGISEVEASGQCDPPLRAEQIDKLLEMAVELRRMGETLYWVVEKLLLIACDIATVHVLDGFRREALARYVYGHFLNEIGQLGPAVDQLEKGRCISLDKTWKMDLDMPKRHSLLIQEIVALQSQVLLRIAREYRVKDPKRGIRFCSRALRRLGDPDLALTEAEVLLELGFTYKQDNNYAMARTALAMYLENFGEIVDPVGKCTAFLEVARCYSHLGDVHKAQEYLLKVLELAKNSGLLELTALALKSMGEGFLHIRYYRTASECLGKAFELYTDLNIPKEMDIVRALAAISKGLEVMPLMSLLMNHIFETDSTESMSKLLSWRLHRVPFWAPEADYAPKLPREHLFTTVQIIRERMDEEEKKNLEEARSLREEAVKRVREEERRLRTARRLMRAERMKSGAFVQVFHPTRLSGSDYDSDESDSSYSLLSDDSTPSLIGATKLLLPDKESSLSRITEEMMGDIKKRASEKPPASPPNAPTADADADADDATAAVDGGDEGVLFQVASDPVLQDERKGGFGAKTEYTQPSTDLSEAKTIPSTSAPFPETEEQSFSAAAPFVAPAPAPDAPTVTAAAPSHGASPSKTATGAPRGPQSPADPTAWRYPLTRNKGWAPTLPIAGRYPVMPLSEKLTFGSLRSVAIASGGWDGVHRSPGGGGTGAGVGPKHREQSPTLALLHARDNKPSSASAPAPHRP